MALARTLIAILVLAGMVAAVRAPPPGLRIGGSLAACLVDATILGSGLMRWRGSQRAGLSELAAAPPATHE